VDGFAWCGLFLEREWRQQEEEGGGGGGGGGGGKQQQQTKRAAASVAVGALKVSLPLLIF